MIAMATGKCKVCKTSYTGKIGKIFCSSLCKAHYHRDLQRKALKAAFNVDKILHRNRSTLFEIMGNTSTSKKIKRKFLDEKKFNWHHITGYHINSNNKMVHIIYDFTWMIFSDQEVLVKRIKR